MGLGAPVSALRNPWFAQALALAYISAILWVLARRETVEPVVADQPPKKLIKHRLQGGQPRSLRHSSDAEAAVAQQMFRESCRLWHVLGAARASVSSRWDQV